MPTPPASVFANLLRTTREAQGLTQTELADRSSLTPAAISQLEAGERLPAYKTLVALADALNTSAGYLLGEENTELPPPLKAFFRDLKELDAADMVQVRNYAAYLRSQAAHKQK